MTNNVELSPTGYFENSTERDEKMSLGASTSKLLAIKLLANKMLEAAETPEARALARELIEMLNELISESEAQTEQLYEWATG